MSGTTIGLVREVFSVACNVGPASLPTTLEQFLVALRAGTALTADAKESLDRQLAEEFPMWQHRTPQGPKCDEPLRAKWEAAVRAVLLSLRSWSLSNAHALAELSAYLQMIESLGLESADFQQIAAHLDNDVLADGLYQLILESEVGSYMRVHERIPNAEREIKKLAQENNFLRISHIFPNLMPEMRMDLRAAVRLLLRLDPAKLASALTVKNSVFFTLLVRFILGDDFPELASHVPIMWVKFASIDVIENAHRSGNTERNWRDLLRHLLLQAAVSPAWPGWMSALLRVPQSGSLMTRVLPNVLASLDVPQWEAFIAAVSLNYSKMAAEPMAAIMLAFEQATTASAALSMWTICFKRWSGWDYGRSEEQTYLFSPAACALDYPVAMYYSKMPSQQRDDLERTLALSIETIEQQWFKSATELITERNRLLSRQRLVEHGRRLASDYAEPLPPAIQQPDAYTSIRYSYLDVQASRSNDTDDNIVQSHAS
ncbi:hypothetical protein [Burkholderia ubonensis]|uniref:Uncharacterized protein n=1 Tax=Burkholderia ubonensis TaxID=101571 RepID=A0AB74D2W2_9BURK|nr:hypothetical protein [Burkholderia ubonensis]PAJ78282.1 hypothetical protein CJO71_24485 [Burkholderia ubonensis]PAJ91755.1 hypothetical protein CJO69_25625 [Burkholderia ubonensis]RQP65531.1 hypothetical protein DF013_34195 [Burkholderia ubonensis]RQP68860.1 hypothetical protein DF015_33130 [Burkholderia ubonensis]